MPQGLKGLQDISKQPQPMPSNFFGYALRSPFDSELDYFKNNKQVAGMAAEDGKIILNPFSNLSDEEKMAVAKNEAIRLFMRENKLTPEIELTDSQRRQFIGTAYESNEDAAKQTIIARILSGDPSALAVKSQNAEAMLIMEMINNRMPRNKGLQGLQR